MRHPIIFTADGNVDVESMKICNIKAPISLIGANATNKKYIDIKPEELHKIKAENMVKIKNTGKGPTN